MQSRLKIAGAVVLLLSLALPVEQVSVPGSGVRYGSNNYVFGLWASLGMARALLLLAITFVWPVIWLAVARWNRGGIQAGVALRIAEAILLLWSVMMVLMLSSATFLLSSRPGPGAYAAILGLALYAAGAIWADAVAFQAWRRGRSR